MRWVVLGKVGATHASRNGSSVARVSPSVETLRKYAAAVGKKLRVEMV